MYIPKYFPKYFLRRGNGFGKDRRLIPWTY